MAFVLGLLFGAVGTGFMVYGRKQHDALYLLTGFALIIYPYFFTSTVVVVIIGTVLSLVPVAHSRGWF